MPITDEASGAANGSRDLGLLAVESDRTSPSTTMPNLLATDSYTVALGIAALGAYLLNNFLTPQSLVHPILLGRQSDVDRVRKPGESAVYRNYGTGLMGSVCYVLIF